MSNAKTNTNKTNKKVNDIVNALELKNVFIECNILPKFTDSKHYVGCGVRANVFSVNALKTQYNVYCNDQMFDLFENSNFDIECIKNGNSNDKTRNNTVICKSTETLKKMLSVVGKNFSSVCLTN